MHRIKRKAAVVASVLLIAAAQMTSAALTCRYCKTDQNCGMIEVGYYYCNQDPNGDCWAYTSCSSGPRYY
jgi:hypothetical protein